MSESATIDSARKNPKKSLMKSMGGTKGWMLLMAGKAIRSAARPPRCFPTAWSAKNPEVGDLLVEGLKELRARFVDLVLSRYEAVICPTRLFESDFKC